jgi:hypothetical protein
MPVPFLAASNGICVGIQKQTSVYLQLHVCRSVFPVTLFATGKTRPYDTAINMSKPDVCVTELIFILVQWQTYARWISSKTLTRRKYYKTGWFRETNVYTLLRSRFTYILNLSQVRVPCTKHISENTFEISILAVTVTFPCVCSA